MRSTARLSGPAGRTGLPVVVSRPLRLALVGGLVLGAGAMSAHAQNVSSVFGPGVDPGERAIQYRLGIEPGEDGGDTEYAHRFHGQYALNDAVRLRAITQVSSGDTGDGDLEFDYVQGELLWQYQESGADGYAAGFRFDYRLNEGDDRADQIGANWTHQWALANDWRFRAILLLDVDVGEGARDGLFVESRMSLTRKLDNGLRIGLDSFNDYGDTDSGFGSFQDQGHQLGPVISGDLGGTGWEWFFGPLFGLSDGAPDTDIQLRLGRAF